MKVHYLKCFPEYFSRSKAGLKNFEIRLNDRNFQVGDKIVLQEYDLHTREFTGNEIVREIQYILKGGQFGIDINYVILELKLVSKADSPLE